MLLFSDANVFFGWKNSSASSGKAVTFDDSLLSADRAYTLPDASGTVALTSNNLSAFAATSSAQLRSILSDEKGTGAILADGATSPSFNGDVTLINGKLATAPNGQTTGLQLDAYVPGASFDNYVLNNSPAATTYATLNFGRLTSLLYGFIRSNNTSTNLEIGTGGTPRLTIDQSGNTTLSGNLLLPSAGVINFNSGDVTITHSANALAFAGASSGYSFDANVGIGTTSPGALLDVAGTFRASDSTDTTKRFQFDVSNVATATTRTVNIPNANSTTAQSVSAVSHFFLTAMDAQGLFSASQPSFSDITGNATTAQGGTNKTSWTAGSIPYLTSSSAFAEDNSNLFWDGSCHCLGIGTTSPSSSLTVSAATTSVASIQATGTVGSTRAILQLINPASGNSGWDMTYNADLSSQNFIIRELTAGSTLPRFTLKKTTGLLQLNAYGAGTLTTDASGNVTATSDERLKTKKMVPPAGLEPAALCLEGRCSIR